jgi:hypothetical protein
MAFDGYCAGKDVAVDIRVEINVHYKQIEKAGPSHKPSLSSQL